MSKYEVWFDGACEPRNPGGWATYGFVIRDAVDKSLVKTGHGVAYPEGHKLATNNVAQYSALGFALRWLADEKWNGELVVYGDSQLVVNQVNGLWACNKEHLQRLRDRVLELLECVGKPWSIRWVSRDNNEEADSLSRLAYTQVTGRKFPERRRK